MSVAVSDSCKVKVVLFDFGGVLAGEGFKHGFEAIANQNGLDSESLFQEAGRLIHESGYIVGQSEEAAFWKGLKDRTGIKGTMNGLRQELLCRYTLRPWMFDAVRKLRASGLVLGILSDQTNWLDELEATHGFFKWFDFVFNSYHLGKSKQRTDVFDDIPERLNTKASKILFIDDNAGNIQEADQRGFQTILYEDKDGFLKKLRGICPGIHLNGR